MPAPATAAELLDLVQRSGVADESRLRAYVQKVNTPAALPPDPATLAGILVRDGVLTYFQAEQLLQGKYKRFTIGKYKVLEKLGAGGMAQVFLCEHKLMRRRVAIKVLPTAKADDPASLDRFYREARAVAAVDHPNIVRAYDIDQDENLHFLVMEYVDGTNLQDLVKKFGPLDVTRACHYVYGAAVGLQHAHEIGLVHRDIKPGNILVERAGVVKILDMGLARFFHDEDDQLTRQNDENVLGTADYLAPEQALDSHAVDIRADIYSLGGTFYYLLTGSAPFPDGSVAQKLIWHQNRQPRPVKSLRPDVPDEVAAIVERMMAKKPEGRYQTPAGVMEALVSWVATPIPPPDEREMPVLSLAAGGTGSNSGTNRGPATMIGPVITPATSPAAGPPGAVPAAQELAAANPLVWESLGREDDTQSMARGDTDDRPRAAPTDWPRRRAKPATRSRRVLYVAAAAVLAAVAAALYFALSGQDAPPQPPPGPGGVKRIVVTKVAGENHVQTLREALNLAGPGDTIVVNEAQLAEPALRLIPARHQGVTIEGAARNGPPPIIHAASQLPAMLDVNGTHGVTIRNLGFNAETFADVGVQVSGKCVGLKLEGVSIEKVKSAAVRLQNASGEDGNPIVLERLHAVLTKPGQSGVLMHAENVDTRHVRLRAGRFDGPRGVGVRVEGPASDVEVAESRFYDLDAAVEFGKLPRARVTECRVTGNTIYQAKVGIKFDNAAVPAAPNEAVGVFRVAVERNYCAQTQALSLFTGKSSPREVSSADNGFGEGCAQGNLPVGASQLTTPALPPPNPENDATFLRFPGSRPTVGGKEVGAP